MGFEARKPVFEVWDNKGADQSVHLRRLISTSVIIILESIISKLSKFEFSLCNRGNWFESQFVGSSKDRFCHLVAHNRMTLLCL